MERAHYLPEEVVHQRPYAELEGIKSPLLIMADHEFPLKIAYSLKLIEKVRPNLIAYMDATYAPFASLLGINTLPINVKGKYSMWNSPTQKIKKWIATGSELITRGNSREGVVAGKNAPAVCAELLRKGLDVFVCPNGETGEKKWPGTAGLIVKKYLAGEFDFQNIGSTADKFDDLEIALISINANSVLGIHKISELDQRIDVENSFGREISGVLQEMYREDLQNNIK